jgi:hypothetical protein
MECNTNTQFSKAHLTTLKFNNFKMIEAVGLKIIASRSPRMALPLYQISCGSKVISGGHTDRLLI